MDQVKKEAEEMLKTLFLSYFGLILLIISHD